MNQIFITFVSTKVTKNSWAAFFLEGLHRQASPCSSQIAPVLQGLVAPRSNGDFDIPFPPEKADARQRPWTEELIIIRLSTDAMEVWGWASG